MSSHIVRHHILGSGEAETVNPNPESRLLAENGDFLMTEDSDNIITE